MMPHELRAWRSEHKLTQLATSRLLHVTTVTIRKWEQGITPIDRRTELALAWLSQELIAGRIKRPKSDEPAPRKHRGRLMRALRAWLLAHL